VTWLSKPAVLWAMDEANGVPARLRSTLFAVARYAGEDGRGAFPSLAQVAWITGKSRAQAGKDIAALVELGVLLPGDPGLVKDIRADVRPNVYDLAMRVSPRRDARVSSGRDAPGGSRVSSGARTGLVASKTASRLGETEEDLKRSSTARGRVGARAPRAAPRAPQTQTPRIAPPCPDCSRPYTAGQLADDGFYRKAMGGDAGCIHEAEAAP
jgi:hypothetical protein